VSDECKHEWVSREPLTEGPWQGFAREECVRCQRERFYNGNFPFDVGRAVNPEA
jgi:hypothetical protein